MPARIIYKTGDKLHPESRLTFVEDVDGLTHRKALFACDCGNETKTHIDTVKRGITKSCGCYLAESASLRRITHGMSGSKEYKTWTEIIQRCANKKNKDYCGRGITVCDEWLNSFEEFYADMGDRPFGMSIDRKDNEKGYSKANCRWATPRQQARNRRSNHNLTLNGKTQSIAAWSVEIGVNSSTLCMRINAYGWSAEKTLTTGL